MRILLLNNFHYRKGGSEAVYFNTAELLKQNGHEVEFYSLKGERNYPSRFSHYFAVSSIDCSNRLAGASKYLYNREVEKGLDKVIAEFKPDVAHIHLIWGGLTGAALKTLKRHDIPIVHTAHDFRMVCPAYLFIDSSGNICEECRGRDFKRCLSKRCGKDSLLQSGLMTAEAYYRVLSKMYRDIDHVHYVSRFSRDKHFQYNTILQATPSTFLYNFVADPGEPTVKGRDYFTFLGRLSKEKGIKNLVEAFHHRPTLKLRIIGTGPLEDELKILTSNLDNIEILGYKTGNELKKLVATSRFVTIPSEWYENNPMSALESFSMGVPVIGANIGGIPEIVKPGITGFLFESGNVDSLLNAVDAAAALSEEEYQALCASTRKEYLENYTPESYYPKLMEIYDHAINHNKKHN